MKYIECPEIYDGKDEHSLFIAGGISNCPDWQNPFIKLLANDPVTIVNPRRKNFDVSNPNMEREQIEWEYKHLGLVNLISFWFPCETLCPITLFELGDRLHSENQIFVGCHPDYKRIRDVKIQTALRRPGFEVVENLEELADQVRDWLSAPF